MITKSLVRQLIDAAHESGYYSGKGEGGEFHHVEAVKRRKKLRDQIFRILDKEERGMTDKEMIEQTKAELERRKVNFGDFWQILRSPTSLTTVFFWGKPKGCPNYSCQFDEEAGKLLWCNA